MPRTSSKQGGIGFTHRGNKIEAAYNVPASELPDGAKRKRITAWGDSENGAQKNLMLKLAKQSIRYRGPVLEDGKSPITLSEWLDEWMEDYVAYRVQPATARNYRFQIEHHIKPYVGDVRLEDLDPRTLTRKWWVPLQNKRKLDANGQPTDQPLLREFALANVFKTLRQALNAARDKFQIHVGLFSSLMAEPKTKRPEDDEQARASARQVMRVFFQDLDKRDPRYSQFMPALLGLRQGERLGLEVDAVVLDGPNPRLIIRKQLSFVAGDGHFLKDATKNGTIRTVPLFGDFLKAMKIRMELREEWSSRNDWDPEDRYKNLFLLRPGGKLLSKNPDNDDWHSLGFDFRPHLSRHITGYVFGHLGVGTELAGRILGHQSETYTTYYRPAFEEVAARELSERYDPREFLRSIS